MKFLNIILLILVLGIISCKSDQSSKYPKLDLLSHGVPIEINAPEGAEVKMTDLGVMKDVTVKGGEDYFIQILSSEATTMDRAAALENIKKEVKETYPYFSKVTYEDEAGFIFEKKIDERTNYDFRLVKIQGDDEYIFQTGLMGTFTEDQVKNMYDSVK